MITIETINLKPMQIAKLYGGTTSLSCAHVVALLLIAHPLFGHGADGLLFKMVVLASLPRQTWLPRAAAGASDAGTSAARATRTPPYFILHRAKSGIRQFLFVNSSREGQDQKNDGGVAAQHQARVHPGEIIMPSPPTVFGANRRDWLRSTIFPLQYRRQFFLKQFF